ncbi:Enhancer of rudimentary -like protein [Toxocara canis]|uniref:Enhancer of rudimentary homolog n=2 Tax=Toxocara canis TaxID=6265 RepID=A0A0B2VGJ2_TOXCA|nr:Enhancer of rudimentary -like protein [Toxocara canis]VDM41618.1 unnamed protein product [Toxocara canis]
MSHTVLLIQPSPMPQSRTWLDYETLNACLRDVCKMFEVHLKNQNARSTPLTYDVHQLFNFIDRLGDLSCFVWDADMAMYAPHNKQWIKEQIYVFLRGQVADSLLRTKH